jgi:hypothetical protein
MAGLGFAQGEHTETGGFPRELYVREARRMVGDAVMTQAHYAGHIDVDDPVALGNYFADSHHVRRIVVGGTVHAEGNTGGGPESIWGISHQSIVPADGEAGNLVVSTTVSASSVAWNSLRMEPTFMVLGQSAATAAALALHEGVDVQHLDYAVLRERLIADGQVLRGGTHLIGTGAYDENEAQANTVDTEAAGNDIPLGAFKTLVADAYANDRGGVIDFDGTGFRTDAGLDVAYGVSGTPRMTVSVGANNVKGFGEAWRGLDADRTPISYARALIRFVELGLRLRRGAHRRGGHGASPARRDHRHGGGTRRRHPHRQGRRGQHHGRCLLRLHGDAEQSDREPRIGQRRIQRAG